MKSHKHSLLAMVTAAAMAIAVSAQQPTSGTDSNQQMSDMKNMQGMQTQKGDKASGNQIMQSCHQRMQAKMHSNVQTTKDIEAAKQSNDPAKMRAALDEAEKALAPMNQDMERCMKMMLMTKKTGGRADDQAR